MTALAIILALVDIALAVWLMAETAPEGWEDADGFHYGKPDGRR